MTAYEVRQEIVRLGKLLHDKGFVAATDGNISVRLDERRVLATPTCLCKGMMTVEDLVVVDVQGHKLEGFREVSSEIAMHIMIYRNARKPRRLCMRIRQPLPGLPLPGWRSTSRWFPRS